MIIIIALIVSAAIAWMYFYRHYSDVAGGVAIVLSMASIIVIGTIPISQFSARSLIAQMRTAQLQVDRLRQSDVSSLEYIAIQSEILRLNRELSAAKFYRKTIFGIWQPSEVEQAEYIK